MAKKIREIMSPAPVSLAATEPVSAAARALKDHGIGTVFVLARGVPVGIVSIGELALEEKDPRGQSALCAAPPNA